MIEGGEPLPVYAVRPSDPVSERIEAEHDRIEWQQGIGAADAWEDALMDAVASLATLPDRCPVAPENGLYQSVRPGQDLRQLIHRRTRGSAAWRILFTVHEADANDPPTVKVQHIRHGGQAPLTEWPAEDQ